jgi:predicted lysophospholipase L1 biosynthesis ABC-type transport system permease subunit
MRTADNAAVAVWWRVRAELRTRWRAALSLALLLGLTGGVVMAAAAGARRTHTAYTRFVRSSHTFDVAVMNDQTFGPSAEQLARIEELPAVQETVRGIVDYARIGVGVPFFAPADPRMGDTFDRFKIVKGRDLDRGNADEALVGFVAADRYGVHVGDRIQAGAVKERFVRVVGIVAAPGEFPPQTVGLAPTVHLSPAAYRVMRAERDDEGNPPKESVLARLKPGADVDAFRRQVERISPTNTLSMLQRDLSASTQRSFRLQSLALWVLSALTALVGLLILSQVVARQVFIEGRDDETLSALGMTRGQRVLAALTRALLVSAAGAAIAAAVAVALSPLTPVGLARLAEPAPGVRLDGLVLGLGSLVTLALGPVLAVVPALRAQRAPDERRRVSTVTEAMSRSGFPVTTVTGARLALEPGRGRTAVPVRTTLATAVVAVAAVAAAFTFGAGLDHLIHTPRLYGQSWDTTYTTFGDASLLPGAAALERDPAVAAYSIGTFGAVDVDGVSVGAMAFEIPRGTVIPPILSGRAPRGTGEIALGTRTLEKLHKHIGDRVTVSIGDQRPLPARVVGETVVPNFFGETRLGEGALVTLEAALKLDAANEAVLPSEAVVRWTATASAADKARVRTSLGRVAGRSLIVLPRETPDDIVNFGRVQNMPLVLGAVLALLGAATLTHTLVTAIGRRRRDLAVFKTVGFVRGQITSTVAWQATTMVAIALLAGLPVGVALGRWAWITLAHQIGVVSEPVTPLPTLLLLVPATVLLANLIALAPASLAARIRPALALRAE